MNARLRSHQMHTAFDTSSDYKFPMNVFAPDIAKVTCMNFPMQEIAADIGIHDAQAVTLEEVLSNKIQSLNSMYAAMSREALSLLPPSENGHSPLALDILADRDNLTIHGLRATASNGRTYLCANISVIRNAVEQYSAVAYGDLDQMAKALQKALVAKALQDNKPVIVFECLIENADKEILYKGDRFLHEQASNDNGIEPKISVERRGQSLYTFEDVKNPYYSMP